MKRPGKKIQPISTSSHNSAQVFIRKSRFIKIKPAHTSSTEKSPGTEQKIKVNRLALSVAGNQWPRTVRTFINILLILAVIAGLGLYTAKNDSMVLTGAKQGSSTVHELERIDSAAKAVEVIFAAADTNQLAKILSPVTLKKRRPYFPQLIKFMPAFAADFKTRKLQLLRARYAVYEFKSARGKFVVEFCTDSRGCWVLMNF